MKIDKILDNIEEFGDNHIASSTENPVREDAFDKSDQNKKMLHKLGLCSGAS